ncbi:ABC transporter permease subunit [Pseudaminobacter sp. NGMCC 1.201702]|uniref:ABC transporter permease subunit n=1 Tax=Pseudaminobacter sp. NGMCC 1.201702 TaxID=3391825 RepID=UPI0039EF5BA2
MTVQQQSEPQPRFDLQTSAWSRRRKRIKHDLLQLAIIVAMIGVLIAFALAVRNGLARHGISFSFDYLWQAAGFDISEGKTLSLSGSVPSLTDFTAADSNAQALLTGLFNTIKVALLGIILSTVLGTMLGVGRLSTNWLVRQISFGVVEFVRNTPLLIQLVFWYFAVVLQFPPLAAAAKFYGGIIISRQSTYLPWPILAEGATTPAIVAVVAGVALALAALFLKARPRLIVLGLALAAVLLSIAFGFPFALDYPVANRFRAAGGISISPEMAALLLAIIVNSASYIAEIVRGAIEAIHKGQWEAAAALGLSRRNTLGDVILPQVFRVVLPSLGNQYINLTKNTALGIAIGFPELFNIYGTIANQTGRTLEGIVIVMVVYLLLSWVISAAVNFANSRLAKGTTR